MNYNFNNGAELLALCEKSGFTIAEAMLQRECQIFGQNRELMIEKMHESLQVMKVSIAKGVVNRERSVGGLIGGESAMLNDYKLTGKSLLPSAMLDTVINSMAVLEVNASMGRIVACPTAGSCGILPGALVTKAIELGKTDDEIVTAMFTAAAVGYLFSKNATVAGAEGGCQAETGTAAAMAAAGLVEMMGGTPEAALSSAAFSIKNILGLVCDPIAGLVECPCQKRNGLLAVNALISADMALAGIKTIIPFDEVVDAMYRVGKLMSPTLKETALGGMAATETGKMISKRIFG